MWDPRDSEAATVAGAAVYAGNSNGTDVVDVDVEARLVDATAAAADTEP